MSLSAAAIRLMAAKGMTADDIADIAEAMEAPVIVPDLSAGAIRQRRYRERLAATGLSGEEWRLLSMRVIARDGNRCQYCETTKGRMCCDHIVPLLSGGGNEETNLVCACEGCNGGKSGKSVEEWKGATWAAAWFSGRSVTSRNVTTSHVGERPQVVTPSLPSLRSEELKTPKLTSFASPKPKSKSVRSRLCPADWTPTPADMAVGTDEGFSPGEIERELAKFREHEFRDPHSHWSPTFRKWLRTAAERKPRNGPAPRDAKFAARQDNLARHERGFELAARLHDADRG